MTNTEAVKSLKDIHVRVMSASSRERQAVFDDLQNVLDRDDVPEAAIKGISRLLPLTLHRYNDSKSRFLVDRLITTLATRCPQASMCHMSSAFQFVAQSIQRAYATSHLSRTCITALRWLCSLVRGVSKNISEFSNDDFAKLVESVTTFVGAIAFANRPAHLRRAHHQLGQLWVQSNGVLALFVRAVSQMEPSYNSLIMSSFIVKHLTECKELEQAAGIKAGLLDNFVKIVISSKSKPLPYIVAQSAPLLKLVTHEEFRSLLLPAIQKGLLRNPELILGAVGLIVTGLSLDLSQYALELGKNLGTLMHSKDDNLREEAVQALKSLTMQCSDPDSLKTLFLHLLAVLNGSEGKLTVNVQRIGIITGLGFISHNLVPVVSVQPLAGLAAQEFIKSLELEVHEGTLVHTLAMLSLWCSKFTSEVPKSLMEGFKKGVGLKASTSAVQNAYYNCMATALRGNTLSQGEELVPILLKAVERATAQPTVVSTVTEGLSATALLLRMSSTISHLDAKLGVMWNLVLDTDKRPFTVEKFLAAASDEALGSLISVYELLYLEFPTKLKSDMKSYHRAVIYILTRSSYAVRRNASVVMKRVLSATGGSILAVTLMEEFSTFLHSPKTKVIVYDADNVDSVDVNTVPATVTPSDGLLLIKSGAAAECAQALCAGLGMDNEEREAIAISSLSGCHHPGLMTAYPYLFLQLSKRLDIDASELLSKNLNQIWSSVLDDQPLSLTYANVVKTLVRLCPRDTMALMSVNVESQLTSPGVAAVTETEYMTFLTPEGQLYDTSVIHSVREEVTHNKNIKRESKAYSYKDQMDEIELRKELEAKKKGKDAHKEPQLTPKQQELKKAQLIKESGIRSRILELHKKASHAIALVSAAIDGKSEAVQDNFFCPLLQSVLSALNSPVSAPAASDLYIQMHECVFRDNLKSLGYCIGNITLRALDPKCGLNEAWCQNSLDSSAMRAIRCIHSITVRGDTETYDETREAQQQSLTAPAFTYIFPLFGAVLKNAGNKLHGNESSIVQGLEIIVEHAQMRAMSGDSDEHLFDPSLLPRKQMMTLLINMLETTSGATQKLVRRVLLQVAEAASGKPGCATATVDEVQILLTALMSSDAVTRDASLSSLLSLVNILKSPTKIDTLPVNQRIWIAKFDVVEENGELADKLWKQLYQQPQSQLCEEVLTDIIHPVDVIRQAAADALARLLADFPDKGPIVLNKLLDTYRDKLALPPPKLDDFGRVISDKPIDFWEPRSGVAVALKMIAPQLPLTIVSSLTTFFIFEGLSDRNEQVQREMLEAAQSVVDIHGKETVSVLLPLFQDLLDKAPDSSSYDVVRQSVVILMGSLARHMVGLDDERVLPIVDKLVEALSTPSQKVQEAVANCLPPLVPSIREQAPRLVEQLLRQLVVAEAYGARRGAAYGLAGLVKGLGILSLKQLNVMAKLTENIQHKKNWRAREGALFAFEMLCNMLGRLFEPYVVHVLPHLLLCFGDSSQYVREATDDTAKAVMSKLSAHGVKLVLPALLDALEEESWRTKTGSIDLLGAMAFCAPKQLSSCLPSIVPKLIEVLSDSHVRVQKAGAQALKQIGSVIRNPEIQALVPTLMDALQEPTTKTSPCLQTLLDTKFVHFIDAPSLALIMPVVQRAFQDRSTETRKMAAQIIGNMYSLTDQKDLAPYLPNVIPGLKQSLLDPVPEVRGVAARALGAMVRGMGESSFDDLLPWLMQTLTSEASSVDRSGAAQGLSEVVGGLGVDKLYKLMPDIISTAERTDIAPHVKDGYIMMFIYMPVVFQKEFTPYIGQIINPILKALADENEFVRETALRAGQRIVNMYAESAIALLLPELERGLFDDNWRIRYSSVQLLGDLLYKISGVTGKMSTETASEDDNFGTEHSHKAILSSLGTDRRNRLLAGLYMGRSDIALMVRQAALHVWKVVVPNTPRTLREILPTLFSLLLGCLASTSYDKRQVAARTLGDLVRKLGERVLPDIIPILENGLESDRADQRQGVCIGLSEIMGSTSREMVMTFVDSLVPTVRKALCDPLPEVRRAAAKTFDSLHSTVGGRALDDILSPLLKQLDDPKVGEYALDGLRQVTIIKSKVALPYLIPQLTSCNPVNTQALSVLASVSGEALTKHLVKVMPALLLALSQACNTSNEQQELEYCQAVVLSVTDYQGVHTIMDELLEATRSRTVGVRRAATMLLCAYCQQSKANYSQYVPQLLRGLIHLFMDEDERVLQVAWEALNAVTKDLESSDQAQHVADVRQAVRFTVSDLGSDKLLPGFCLPKGIVPILPIFREAIINGPPELKEQAANGLGEVIRLTNAEALKSSVVNITGPLIRILGDRYASNVRVAVLETLALLLAKVGAMLKPFLPQLQTTFLKALSDPNRQVRIRAGSALSHLIVIHTRADPLFTELHNSVRSVEDTGVKETMLQALRSVISPAGDKMSDAVRQTVLSSLQGMLGSNEDPVRMAAAGCLGALCRTLTDTELSALMDTILEDDPTQSWTLQHGYCVTLMVALIESPEKILQRRWTDAVGRKLLSYVQGDRVPVTMSGLRCIGAFMRHQLATGNQIPLPMIQVLTKSINHNSNEVKQVVAQVGSFLAQAAPDTLSDALLKPLILSLVNGTKEKNSVVKSSCEFALVAILRMRSGDETQQACFKLLDSGARESLADVIAKSLRKVASQPEPKEEQLDDTLIT